MKLKWNEYSKKKKHGKFIHKLDDFCHVLIKFDFLKDPNDLNLKDLTLIMKLDYSIPQDD